MTSLLWTIIFVLIAYCVGQKLDQLCEQGKNQSPVNIDPHRGLVDFQSIPEVECNFYDQLYRVPITNNGYTVRIAFENETFPPFITTGIFGTEEYILNEIHFHWNSEHTVNGKRFPLEGHFVHYLREAGNFSNALNVKNGVMVLGVFYEFSQSRKNKGFDEIIQNMQYIAKNLNKPVWIKVIPARLLPRDLNLFYTYQGSLTTPNCNEGIQWIIFDVLSNIHTLQYRTLTKIYSAENNQIKTNNRVLQPLNNRRIYYSFGLHHHQSSFHDY